MATNNIAPLVLCALGAVIGFGGCASAVENHVGVGEALAHRDGALETQPLIITEVAQSTTYAGSNADKVEVFCTNAGGCAAYKVCDTTSSGFSCSDTHAALGAPPRAGVSRGTSITSSDEVWLTDSAGSELVGT